jgi:hypothetical protein
MSQPSRPFRALGFFKKKEGISDEEFVKHWKEVHGAIVLPFLKKHGALYYSQVSNHTFHLVFSPPDG